LYLCRRRYTVGGDKPANGVPLENFDLVRLIWLIGAMILVLPGFIYGLRNRRAVVRNITIWIALIGVAVALYWLLRGPN
jgi:hypothetical protein